LDTWCYHDGGGTLCCDGDYCVVGVSVVDVCADDVDNSIVGNVCASYVSDCVWLGVVSCVVSVCDTVGGVVDGVVMVALMVMLLLMMVLRMSIVMMLLIPMLIVRMLVVVYGNVSWLLVLLVLV